VRVGEGHPDRLPYTERDHFARCLDGRSTGASRVPAVLVESTTPAQLAQLEDEPLRISFSDLRARAADIAPGLLMGLLGQLHAFNLVHLAGVPGIRTPQYANYPIELTALGARLVTHLVQPGV